MNAQERPENDSNLLPLAELEVLHKQEVKAKTALQVARMFKICPTHRELFIGWENYWFKAFKDAYNHIPCFLSLSYRVQEQPLNISKNHQ